MAGKQAPGADKAEGAGKKEPSHGQPKEHGKDAEKESGKERKEDSKAGQKKEKAREKKHEGNERDGRHRPGRGAHPFTLQHLAVRSPLDDLAEILGIPSMVFDGFLVPAWNAGKTVPCVRDEDENDETRVE